MQTSAPLTDDDTSTEHLRQVNALLAHALALPDAQARAAWLDTLPPTQQTFVPLLQAMLAQAGVETNTFLQRPVDWALASGEEEATQSDQPGDQIGPYRLLETLGAGGMATVWLAERNDGMLNRQVALKLPHHGWGLGLAQRMARERDMLGALAHPRIARLYDAGVTTQGRPWMAMECVTGAPIDSYCRARKLDVPARLRLFLQVADAVSHAHSRLIVHRDLKPNNILVTPAGEVRLLDFGVAKLLESDALPGHNLTQMMGRAVTPSYASPEQVGGKPVTVATDVYSLGVVLYELLTGNRPYKLARTSAAALEEAILNADVPLASSRVQTDKALARQLRGDIDTILAKALQKAPDKRYASVESMAADITRHLQGEPVLAQAPSQWYRARKFMLRHRAGLVSASLVVLALLAGLAGTLTQTQRAEKLAAQASRERDTALRELAYSEATDAFVRGLLTQGSGKAFTTDELLAQANQTVQTQFAGDAALRTRLQMAVAELYGNTKNLTQMGVALDQAEVSARAAGSNALVAHVQCARAGLLASTGKRDQALAMFDAIMPNLEATAAGDVSLLVSCYGYRSQLMRAMGRAQAAIDDAQHALAIIGTPRPARLQAYGGLHATLAAARSALDQPQLAIEGLESAIGHLDNAGLLRSTAGSTLVNNLGVALWRSGQYQRAAQVFERWLLPATQAEQLREHALMTNYGRFLTNAGRVQEGFAWLERAQTNSTGRGDAQNEAFLALGFAGGHCALHDFAQCDAALETARQKMQKVRPEGHAVFGVISAYQAESFWARGDSVRARETMQAALAILERAEESSSGRVSAHALMARIQAQAGELAQAKQHADLSMQLARKISAGFTHSEPVAQALIAQGFVKRAQGDHPGAAQSFNDAVEHLRRSVGETAPAVTEALAFAANKSN